MVQESRPSLADEVEIANPQEPHVPVVLVLDVSGSMAENGKIDQLRQGLEWFRADVERDELASKRVDVAVVTFGADVRLHTPFGDAGNISASDVAASGPTPLAEAIRLAVEVIEDRKRAYRADGIDYYRPWVFLVTDGEPTDMRPGDPVWKEIQGLVRDGDSSGRFSFFTVAVEPANADNLRDLAPVHRPPVQLAPGRFKEMFVWLSRSQRRVSASRPGEQIVLETPREAGWSRAYS